MRNEPNKTEQELLTILELGKILKLRRTALYAAMKKGQLPPGIKIGAGGHWRWRKNTVEKWLQEREEIPKPSQKNQARNHRRGRPTKGEEVSRRREGKR